MKKETNYRIQNYKKQKTALLGLKKQSKDLNTNTQKKHAINGKQTKNSNIDSIAQEIKPIASVAIMGRPNVGKSSLFNRLNQKNIAITSHISGSTRDINKRDLRLNNFDITLIDTGGLEVLAHKLKEFYRQTATKQSVIINETDDLHSINLSNPRKQALIAEQLKEHIAFHSYQVVATSDIIIYMVDGSGMVSDDDIRIFRALSKQKPLLLVLNKVDSDKIAMQANEFMAFGVPYITISVAHNRGITKLLSSIENMIQSLIDSKKIKPKKNKVKTLDFLDYFDDTESIITFEDYENIESNSIRTNKDFQNLNLDKIDSNHIENSDTFTNSISQETLDNINEVECNKAEEKSNNISVGIIGRPNVGKSSLLNALTNTNRSLVSDIAGTTIDPVDAHIVYNGYKITFVDTAGIRRRSKIEGIEKYALDRTQKMLQECDIALLVLDCSTDFVELDEKISSMASNNQLGIVVVFHKWDIRSKEFDSRMEIYKRKFKFLEYAPIITASSTTHRHIKELKQKIIEVYKHFSFRIPTAKLNDCIQNALKKHPIPSDHGKLVKIYYATQFDSKPPKIALIMNRPNALHFSYKRYLINTLRKTFGFIGTPIIIEARDKNAKELPDTENKHNN